MNYEQTKQYIIHSNGILLKKELNTVKLMEYARKLKCENKVRAIMEVFLELKMNNLLRLWSEN